MKKTLLFSALIAIFAASYAHAYEKKISMNKDEYSLAYNNINCDGMELNDVAATAGSNVADSTGYEFTNSDVGKKISVMGAGVLFGAGTAAEQYLAWNSTIQSVSSGNAVLSSNATTTVSNARAVFGTDFAGAINALSTKVYNSGGGTIILSPKTCVVGSSITALSNVSYKGAHRDKSVLFWSSATPMTTAVFSGLSASNENPYKGISFENFTIDAYAAVQSSYSVGGKGIYIQYMDRPVISGMRIYGTPATAIGTDYLRAGVVKDNYVVEGGRLNDGTSLGGSCIGIAVAGPNSIQEPIEGVVIHGNYVKNCGRFGIFLEGYNNAAQQDFITNNGVILASNKGSGIAISGSANAMVSSNNVLSPTNTSPSGQGRGIAITNGSYSSPFPGKYATIANNVIRGTREGIVIDYSVKTPGTAFDMHTITGNKIISPVSYGIYAISGSAYEITNLILSNNSFYKTGGNAIRFEGSGGFKNVLLTKNTMYDVASSGIAVLSGLTDSMIDGNILTDGLTYTLTNGIYFYSATGVGSNVSIRNNHFNSVTNPINTGSGGSWTGVATNNTGYNPVGASAVSPGASPWTYTAGKSPETLYIYGGTVSGITIGGVTVASASPAAIDLPQNTAAIITYSATPSASKYIK